MRNGLSLVGLVGLLVASGCQTTSDPVDRTITLGVAGLRNQTPNLAADGGRVAVSWTALNPDGSANVYVAVSEDAGWTFGAPMRVNDVDGEARGSEQQAPRIAVRSGTIAVLWTARRGTDTQIRVAISQDGGRSFGTSRQISASGAPGIRGWGSLLVDDRGRVHAVWLDTRVAAASAPSTSASGRGHQHTQGAAMPSTRQDVYEATLDEAGSVSERLVATGVCFCCKTAIAQTGEHLWAAWRDVYPGSLRDISFARLDMADAPRVRVSEDRWMIEGCPEDGPALVADASGHGEIIWPTIVSDSPLAKGIFHSSTPEGLSFAPRFRLDRGVGSASHPSLAVSSSGTLLAVWEVTEGQDRRIEMRERRGGDWNPPRVLTQGAPASSPSVAALPEAFLVAWGRGEPTASTIELRHISIAR